MIFPLIFLIFLSAKINALPGVTDVGVSENANTDGSTKEFLYIETEEIKELKEILRSEAFKSYPVDKKNELRAKMKSLIQDQMRQQREARKAERAAANEIRLNTTGFTEWEPSSFFMSLNEPWETYPVKYPEYLVMVIVVVLYLMLKVRDDPGNDFEKIITVKQVGRVVSRKMEEVNKSFQIKKKYGTKKFAYKD